MKALFAAVALGALAISATPAHAVGCLSGAAVGGVAGHVAGHHGFLGAAAGCAVGHHQAVKNRRDADAARAAQQQQQQQPPANTSVQQ